MYLDQREEPAQESNDSGLPKELVWRRNSPYLYQLLYVSELDWPSLTVDWNSTYKLDKNNICDDIEEPYNMILGTHTSSQEPNYLILAKVRVPIQDNIRKKYCSYFFI